MSGSFVWWRCVRYLPSWQSDHHAPTTSPPSPPMIESRRECLLHASVEYHRHISSCSTHVPPPPTWWEISFTRSCGGWERNGTTVVTSANLTLDARWKFQIFSLPPSLVKFYFDHLTGAPICLGARGNLLFLHSPQLARFIRKIVSVYNADIDGKSVGIQII